MTSISFIIISLAVIWILIYPLTDIYARFFARTVVKKGRVNGKKICLSFDDGPDQIYTPLLLSILKETNTPATFFLVGANAEQAPELVSRIIAEGHEIGVHTFYHKHAYLIFLKKSIDSVIKGKKVLEALTGQSLIWFRPPWGALNLFEYICLKLIKMKIVLWSANAVDWKIKTGATGIINILKDKIDSGSIVVLHDSGGDPGAPRNMLQALPELIHSLKTEGFQFVTLSEMIGGISHNRETTITEIQ